MSIPKKDKIIKVKTIGDVYNELTDEQKTMVKIIVNECIDIHLKNVKRYIKEMEEKIIQMNVIISELEELIEKEAK